MADYAASKWAAIGFDEVLRMELREIAPRVKTTVVCPYFVRTEMFLGVRSRFPSLLPILEPDFVADRIVRAVQRNKPRLVMPWIVNLVPLGRMLPISWFDAIISYLGLNNAMDDFVGRHESS
jgi:all-trans-retinol dehydrogenase (NAD+)